MSNKPTILIGPEPSKNPLNSGSCKWFGIDLANELKQWYNVITQKNAEPLKKADLYVVVKSWQFQYQVRAAKKKAIFLAVDNLKDTINLDEIADIGFSYIVLNNQQLYEDWFKLFANACYIPHHIKYFYDGVVFEDRNTGIFWQGMEGNYKYVKEYLDKTYVDEHVFFYLSGKERDPDKNWSYLNFKNGLWQRNHYAWSENKLRLIMQRAGGFLDVKGDDFHQRYKPPTKVLDAIASGVPTAINDCGVRDYMASLGMNLAYPTDTEYWFSREYFDLTQQWKEIIRRDFHVKTVALQYKEVIDKLLEN